MRYSFKLAKVFSCVLNICNVEIHIVMYDSILRIMFFEKARSGSQK
ncbi:hypothetical protein J2810_001616 [Chryseobacterium rhizosphaerae]|nr:hypothetical protein [Chryseobacterium rhizosphaerae]